MFRALQRGLALGFAALLSACATGGINRFSPSDQALMHQIENMLSRPRVVTGRFEQVGPGSWVGRGQFTYHPGYLLLVYDIPRGLRTEAQDQHLVVTDKVNGAVTRIGLARNPLGLLLRRPLRLTHAVQVTQLMQTTHFIRLSLAEAANPSQGLLSLDFEKTTSGLQLKNLIGTDVRKQQIQISLQEDP